MKTSIFVVFVAFAAFFIVTGVREVYAAQGTDITIPFVGPILDAIESFVNSNTIPFKDVILAIINLVREYLVGNSSTTTSS